MILLKIGGAITVLIHLNEHSSLFYFLFVLSFVCFNVLYDSEKQSFVALFFFNHQDHRSRGGVSKSSKICEK